MTKTAENFTVVNGTLNVDLDVFIVPNSLAKVNEFIFGKDERAKTMEAVCDSVGKTFNRDNDLLVQLWYTGELSDNLVDHGATITDEEGNEWYLSYLSQYSYLPVKLFAGMEDGDTLRVKMPMAAYRWIDKENDEGFEKKMPVELVVTLHLNQADYRYRYHGSFASVLEDLIKVRKAYDLTKSDKAAC